jgi:hypothetical protein
MYRRTLLALAIAPSLIVAACGGSDGIDDRLGAADPQVRLVHAVPAAPAVSLFRDDQPAPANSNVTGVTYKGASIYFDVSANSHKFEVKTDTTPTVSVGSATFDAHRGNKYTLVALPDTGSLTTLVTLDDPFDRSVVSDNARVRAFGGALNTAPVDVYLTLATVADISAVAPNLPGVGYKQSSPASGADSQEFEAGAYVLRLTAAGTKTVLFRAPITLGKSADLLLVSVPASATANDMHVLVVRSDAAAPVTELTNTP